MRNSLLVRIPNMADSTSYYRGAGPLSTLRRSIDLNLVFTQAVHWSTLKLVDAIFMQRPFRPEDLEDAKRAKQEGTPLWVDYDDYLFGVPADNPAHEIYGDPGVIRNIAEIIATADVVTVSTPKLKHLIQNQGGKSLNDRVYVVPNGIEMKEWARGVPPKNHKLISWRGSATHMRDCASFAAPIIDASEKNPDWTWAFIGSNPWFITEEIPEGRSLVIKAIDIPEYFELLRRSSPAIHIVPLADSDFNRSKSNIAWIEATHAGAAVIAPDWEEWRKPGVVTYQNQSDMFQAIQLLMDDPSKRAEYNRMSKDYIRDHLLLESQPTRIREKVYTALVGEGDWPSGGDRDLEYDDGTVELQ